MTTSVETRRGLIRRILARYAGSGADVSAALAVATWARVVARFAPLLGRLSVGLIYSRSLELHRSTYPWLIPGTYTNNIETSLIELQQSLSGRPADEVIEASCAVMATFGEILDALIGEHLTTKFLHAALSVNGGETSETPISGGLK